MTPKSAIDMGVDGIASNAIAITVIDGHLQGVGLTDGLLPNVSRLECRLMGRVGHALTRQGMTLQEANDFVLKLLEKYEHVFEKPGSNPGVRPQRAILHWGNSFRHTKLLVR
ncbi:MAG: hypothetical protein JXA42_13810 [Anaerolineales bacterium]|nr:hypothetical protein [Anaerolineales bacterium]